MQKYVSVRSTAKRVLPFEMDEYHVTFNHGITAIHEASTSKEAADGFDGWEIAEQVIYDKDEYLQIVSEKNAALSEQLTQTQLALCELYEAQLT